MDSIMHIISGPWPWYVSGPIIGAMVPLMILIGNRSFGISQNLEHLCAITQPEFINVNFFKYDWKNSSWSLFFAVGVLFGGFLAGFIFPDPAPIQLSQAAQKLFIQWGLGNLHAYNPVEIFGLSINNIILLLLGGIAIGFGTRYAGGCTSGHAITGISTLQPQSFAAVIGIFSGGLFASHFIVPYLVGG